MDPWSILGIAASILQFVDVGYELLSGAKEVYCSAEGMNRQTAELRDLAKDIRRQNEQILSSYSLSKEEKAIKSLAERSLDIAKTLDTKLAKLVVPDNTKFRRLQSAKVSFKVMIQQKDLEELKKRLLDLQNHVQQRLSIILQAPNPGSSPISTDLSSQIMMTIREGQKAFESRQIIESLWFSLLKDREDGIEKAHEGTLDWLFDPNATTFCNWLEHGDGLFWINGLAGRGKSTLMKFAFREERTTTLLEKWANGRRLHIANFFFWNSGLEIQKSQRGLFQSLLCQIFRSDPDLVTTICPTHLPNEPWNTDELKEAYEKLRQHTSTTSVFCFFIDGLDEYSGEESEIIDTLKTLSQVANVKICATSHLMKDIEGKEDYEFLKKRLDGIPPRLEAYFADIINRIDPIYKEETAQIFLLTVEAVQPLPLLALYFLEIERRDTNYAMKIDLQNFKTLDLKNISEIWRVKLKSRCRDLLKPQLGYSAMDKAGNNCFSWQIEYLHRTVRDFLQKNHQAKLFEAAPKDFDAKVSLCRVTLSMLRLHVQAILASEGEKWGHFDNIGGNEILVSVYEFFYYAFKLELLGKGQSQFSEISMVETVTKSLFQDGIDPWVSMGETFLSLLVELGLDQYVRRVLDRKQASLGADGVLLLHRALNREFGPNRLIMPPTLWSVSVQRESGLPDRVFAHVGINLEFIGYLLGKGANVRRSNAFSFFVTNCMLYRYESNKTDRELWFEASKLLVQHGARLDETYKVKTVPSEGISSERFPGKTVRDGMCFLFSADQVREIERIAQTRAKTGWSFHALLPQRFQ
ncbi:hypothetical protein N431DRAFT_444453 [Stipitochalara longipes BDJ]|nr:hypothetical protein N431DRAFT_444453 [Stipitochalara longipes BDJ]